MAYRTIGDTQALGHSIRSSAAASRIHIPVYASYAILDRKPDIATILVRAYEMPVVDRRHKHLRTNGQALIPATEFKAIFGRNQIERCLRN